MTQRDMVAASLLLADRSCDRHNSYPVTRTVEKTRPGSEAAAASSRPPRKFVEETNARRAEGVSAQSLSESTPAAPRTPGLDGRGGGPTPRAIPGTNGTRHA